MKLVTEHRFILRKLRFGRGRGGGVLGGNKMTTEML
jgi:hypothetical protein